MSSQLKIRKAKESDTAVLLEILEQARKFKLSIGDTAWGDYPFTEEDINLRLKTDNCYVAELDSKLVASITLLWEDSHNWGYTGKDGLAGYIHGLLVSDEYRGYKLSQKLINWAEEESKSQGRKYLRLDCESSNKKLCDYYEQQSFKKIKVTNGVAFYQKTL